MKIRFTATAHATYAAVVDYLAEHNLFAAERFVEHVDAALDRVRQFPESGPILHESPGGKLHQFIVKPYRFFYRIESAEILIVEIWHGARLATPPVL